MKKISFIILSILSIVLISGCSDFLDKNPPSTPSEASFWRNKSDLTGALTSCYGTMARNGNWFAYGMPYWDNITDNGYCQHDEGQYGLTRDFVIGNIDPSSGGFVGSIYGACYGNIARINNFIYQLEAYNKNDVSSAEKEVYMGEVLFFRAFYYSFLYRTYGSVPLVTEPLNLETQYQPKVDASKVLEQIFDDLKLAIQYLPEKTYVEAGGHLTKNAARILKARMIMYDGYDDAGNAIASQMDAALTELNQVKGYSLSDNYIDLFQGDQEGNPEIIFSAKYLAPNLVHYGDIYFGCWIVTSPLSNMVEKYEFDDGTPFSATDPRYDPANPTKNRDPRMAETVSFGEFVYDGEKLSVGGNKFQTGYLLSKFLWREKSHIPTLENSYRSESDWVHMRYADVLLMIAEAENELNGPDSIVYGAINQIRQRPSVNLPALPTGLNKDQMRQKIRDERRIEMAFEGQRYFDLKRWKIIGDVMNNLTEPMLPGYKPKYESRFYNWPLPQSEIDKNRGILIQNPDYK